jgi:hypothetical protein
MPQLAADSLRVLERNYPQSPELPKLNALVKRRLKTPDRFNWIHAARA